MRSATPGRGTVLAACLVAAIASVWIAASGGAAPAGSSRVFLPLAFNDYDPLATPTLTPTVTPTATPTVRPVVQVDSSTAFRASSSYAYIVGEVTNVGETAIGDVQIDAVMRNAAFQVVGTGYAKALVGILQPGNTAPFRIPISILSPWSTYELSTSWKPASGAWPALEVTVLGRYFDEITESLHVTGTVRNPYAAQSTSVVLVLTMYDSTGKVIGVASQPADPPDLLPGATQPFDVDSFFWAGMPDPGVVGSVSVIAAGDLP